MPPRRNRLTHKARLRKLLHVQLLRDFTCGEAVAGRGEGLDDAFGGQVVRLAEEGIGVQEALGRADLSVEGFGQEEGDAVLDVFDETDGVDDAGGCGQEDEGGETRAEEEGLRVVSVSVSGAVRDVVDADMRIAEEQGMRKQSRIKREQI